MASGNLSEWVSGMGRILVVGLKSMQLLKINLLKQQCQE